MELQYRPLGVVKEVLERIGLEVTYAYEDLVFTDKNFFLLQFGEKGDLLYYYANVDAAETTDRQIFTTLLPLANSQGISLTHRGRYRLSAGEGEHLSLELLEDTVLK